jgi:hypothetical protein
MRRQVRRVRKADGDGLRTGHYAPLTRVERATPKKRVFSDKVARLSRGAVTNGDSRWLRPSREIRRYARQRESRRPSAEAHRTGGYVAFRAWPREIRGHIASAVIIARAFTQIYRTLGTPRRTGLMIGRSWVRAPAPPAQQSAQRVPDQRRCGSQRCLARVLPMRLCHPAAHGRLQRRFVSAPG